MQTDPAITQTAHGDPERFLVTCIRCDRPILARRAWIGKEVKCPYCRSILTTPEPAPRARSTRAASPNLAPKRRFNFACPRCECLLEAHTGMSNQRAACPTCAARIVVPYVEPGTGLPLRCELLDEAGQAPTPLHAYAASGHQAPRILSTGDLTVIECPRCKAHNDIEADVCAACDTPFTMESAPTVGRRRGASYGATALGLGILSIPLFITVAPGLLAVWFGVQNVLGSGGAYRTGYGIAGLVLGLISSAAAAVYIGWQLLA